MLITERGSAYESQSHQNQRSGFQQTSGLGLYRRVRMTVRAYRNIQNLNGCGEEWLLGPDDTIIAKFLNGQLSVAMPRGSTEATITVIEDNTHVD